MQHFNAADFVALSPAKAKAQALAAFLAAQVEPAADWQGVAYALHSVITRKRGKAASQDETVMQDAADAGRFAPWADYLVTGSLPDNWSRKANSGRVTITFADGWTKSVGLFGMSGKPWAIAQSARLAVASYQHAAARRIAGSDGLLYCGDHYLQGLISVPEISSIESAESDEAAAGDLVWDPVAANAATRELRSGQVDATVYGPVPRDAFMAVRFEIGRRMGLMKTGAEIHMMRANNEAAERVGGLLFPWDRGREPARVIVCANIFAPLMDADPEGFPLPVQPDDELADPRAEMAPSDHETMLAASTVVGAGDYQDAYAGVLSSVSFKERFLLVEDALLAWPALVEPCAFADGEPVQIGEAGNEEDEAETPMAQAVTGEIGEEEGGQHEDTALPPATGEAEAMEQPDFVPPAAVEAVAEPVPAAKPRYRFSPMTGLYELVLPATEI